MRPTTQLLLALALLNAAVAAAAAQRGERAGPRPTIVRVSGGAVHRTNPLVRSATWRVRRTADFDLTSVPQFAGMTSGGAFTLTPMRMLVQDRGALELRWASVSGNEHGGSAVLRGRDQDSSEVRFAFLAAQGKTYLLDINAAEPCSGAPTCPSSYTAPFEVTTPSGVQTIPINMWEAHALVAFVPSADGWYEFRVTANNEWWFYGVTVTTVQ
jgi:hypothetical protein